MTFLPIDLSLCSALSLLSLSLSLSEWVFLSSLIKNQKKIREKKNISLLCRRRRGPRRREAHRHLERVVDAPLQARQRPDHDDAQREPARHQVEPAHLAHDLARRDALVGVELGHEVVGRVRDDRAEDAGDVAGGEGDGELLLLGALGLGLGDDVLVEGLERFFDFRCFFFRVLF